MNRYLDQVLREQRERERIIFAREYWMRWAALYGRLITCILAAAWLHWVHP